MCCYSCLSISGWNVVFKLFVHQPATGFGDNIWADVHVITTLFTNKDKWCPTQIKVDVFLAKSRPETRPPRCRPQNSAAGWLKKTMSSINNLSPWLSQTWITAHVQTKPILNRTLGGRSVLVQCTQTTLDWLQRPGNVILQWITL